MYYIKLAFYFNSAKVRVTINTIKLILGGVLGLYIRKGIVSRISGGLDNEVCFGGDGTIVMISSLSFNYSYSDMAHCFKHISPKTLFTVMI